MRFSAYSVRLPRGVGRSSKVEGGKLDQMGGGGQLDQKSGGGGTWGANWIKSRGGGANWPKVVFLFLVQGETLWPHPFLRPWSETENLVCLSRF